MTASADKSCGAIALRVLRELEPSLVILASVLSIIAAGEAALAASYRANGYIYNSVIGDHFSEQIGLALAALNVVISLILFIILAFKFNRAQHAVGAPTDVAFCVYMNTELARKGYQIYRVFAFIIFFALSIFAISAAQDPLLVITTSYVAIVLTWFKAFSQFTNYKQCMAYEHFCKGCDDYVKTASKQTGNQANIPMPTLCSPKTSMMHPGKVLALNSCALLGKATAELSSVGSSLSA